MNAYSFTELDGLNLALFLALLVGLASPLGLYMAKVYRGEKHFLSPMLGWLERALYRVSGVNPRDEMDWKGYAWALVLFNLMGFVLLLGLQMFQSVLPLNPQGLADIPFPLALNTAVSFVTNTNWQAYSGEAAMSYLTQMLGLGVQNFLSAATGMAVIVVLARGLSKKVSRDLGSFWVDAVRSLVYILLPLSLLFALILVGQGVVQNFGGYLEANTLEGAKQVIPMGPAASQIAIKQLGTNGGGFFGLNSAHPFENPTPFSNFLQMLALLLIPAALAITYGKLVGSVRQGWAIFAAMFTIFLAALGISQWAEHQANPLLGGLPFLEGKELRIGIANSSLWSVATTVASNGSVNAMHDSLSPLGGGVALLNIMLGEVVFGGVGSGLYGILMFVIITVFIAGLMVGRTPEYLGKKIEAREIVLSSVAVLVPCVLILVFSAIACRVEMGLSSLTNKGPHGLSEILYAFTSAVGNNGSAFGGLNANTNFYNYALAFCMAVGRFIVIIPALAIAGSLAMKKTVPPSSGTFPTDGGLFVGLLIGVILIVGALTFFPSLALGPFIEHLMLPGGKLF